MKKSVFCAGAFFTVVVLSGNVHAQATWSVSALWGGEAYTGSGDFNGDGYADVASGDNGNVYMKLSTGSGFTSTTWTATNAWGSGIVVGDFNGDGLDDIAAPSGSNVYMKLSTGSGFTSTTWSATNTWGGMGYTFAGDFNGDGLDDIASADGSSVYMKLSTGSGFTSTTWAVTNSWGGAGWTTVGDFNNDGRTDIASANNSSVYMKLSSGSGFTSQTWSAAVQCGPSCEYYYEIVPSGFLFGAHLNYANDVLVHKSGIIGLHFRPSNGSSSFTNPVIFHNTFYGPFGGAGYTFAGDFDGDGYDDIASFSGSNGYMYIY